MRDVNFSITFGFIILLLFVNTHDDCSLSRFAMLEAIAYRLPTPTFVQAYPGKSFIAMKNNLCISERSCIPKIYSYCILCYDPKRSPLNKMTTVPRIAEDKGFVGADYYRAFNCVRTEHCIRRSLRFHSRGHLRRGGMGEREQ